MCFGDLNKKTFEINVERALNQIHYYLLLKEEILDNGYILENVGRQMISKMFNS